MKVKELTDYLNRHYSEKAAEEWDNVGLLVGDEEQEISHVFLALDATQGTIAEAISCGADMIVTHHPMIFSGIKKINNRTDTGRKVITLIQNHISYYAMHTNFDILGMADLSARYLGLTDCQVLSVTGEDENGPVGLGRVGSLPRPLSLETAAVYVKEALSLGDVRFYGEPETRIARVAVCTGSGKSLIKDVLSSGADAYVTGDIDYHTALDAVAEGLAIIDAGHYGTEYIFADAMKRELRGAFPALKISTASVKSPYHLV